MVRATELMLYYHLCIPPLIKTMHAAGFRIYAWTPDREYEFRTLLDRGVDGIITHRPDRLFATWTRPASRAFDQALGVVGSQVEKEWHRRERTHGADRQSELGRVEAGQCDRSCGITPEPTRSPAVIPAAQVGGDVGQRCRRQSRWYRGSGRPFDRRTVFLLFIYVRLAFKRMTAV